MDKIDFFSLKKHFLLLEINNLLFFLRTLQGNFLIVILKQTAYRKTLRIKSLT